MSVLPEPGRRAAGPAAHRLQVLDPVRRGGRARPSRRLRLRSLTGRHGSPEIEFLRTLVADSHMHDGGRVALLCFALLHPGLVLHALALLARLPRLKAQLSDGPAGRAIAAHNRRRAGIGGWRPASGALQLPEDEKAYFRGKARQAVRTNLTNARKAGVTSRPVRGDEQRALLDELAVLRNHPGLADWLHRQFGEVLECFVAEDADDGLIGVGAVVIDTDVAVVAYHASVPGHPLRSDARWVLWADVIREALRRHARVILVESGPLSLDDGLVYFQRRLGFGVYNLKLRH